MKSKGRVAKISLSILITLTILLLSFTECQKTYVISIKVYDIHNRDITSKVGIKIFKEGKIVRSLPKAYKGWFNFTLPKGEYTIKVFLDKLLLGEKKIKVTESKVVRLKVNVTKIVIKCFDITRKPLETVNYTIKVRNQTLAKGLTNTGIIPVDTCPLGRINIKLSLYGFTIASKIVNVTKELEKIDIVCQARTNIRMVLRDLKGDLLNNVSYVLHTIGKEGKHVIRGLVRDGVIDVKVIILPAEYELKLMYQSQIIYKTSIPGETFRKTSSIELKAEVIPLTIKVVHDETPVGSIAVKLHNLKYNTTLQGLASKGILKLKYVPIGACEIIAKRANVTFYHESIEIGAETNEIMIKCPKYTLDITALHRGPCIIKVLDKLSKEAYEIEGTKGELTLYPGRYIIILVDSTIGETLAIQTLILKENTKVTLKAQRVKLILNIQAPREILREGEIQLKSDGRIVLKDRIQDRERVEVTLPKVGEYVVEVLFGGRVVYSEHISIHNIENTLTLRIPSLRAASEAKSSIFIILTIILVIISAMIIKGPHFLKRIRIKR